MFIPSGMAVALILHQFIQGKYQGKSCAVAQLKETQSNDVNLADLLGELKLIMQGQYFARTFLQRARIAGGKEVRKMPSML